jgi:hypothetical protein
LPVFDDRSSYRPLSPAPTAVHYPRHEPQAKNET